MNRIFILMLAFAMALALVACGGGEKADTGKKAPAETAMVGGGSYEAMDVVDGGTITGVVTFDGAVPKMKKLVVTKDVNVCGKADHFDESLVVSATNGLANVVVKITSIAEGKGFDALGASFQVDQNGCAFIPHITLVPAGTKLTILNSDGVLHNIHTHSEINKSVNIAQPGFKKKMTQTFKEAEIIRIACDVHNWMGGYIAVVDHPYYAVTDANGNFEISGVPAGSYTLEYWQESLGTKTAEVTVTAGASVEANAMFAAGS